MNVHKRNSSEEETYVQNQIEGQKQLEEIYQLQQASYEKDGIAEEAAVKLKEKFEGLQIAGVHSGYGLDDSVLEMINNSKADILIAGMGVPMQEKWIRENKSKLGSVKLFVGGGAILDFLSQRIMRAPLFMRKIGLEWVFRLCLEPGRLWRRYLVGNFLFFYYILVLKLGFKTWSMR